jgi:hypothetical protein
VNVKDTRHFDKEPIRGVAHLIDGKTKTGYVGEILNAVYHLGETIHGVQRKALYG